MDAESFLAYESLVTGTPLLGQRLRDAACAAECLLARPDVEAARGLVAVGWGAAGLLALHLAAVDERVRRVVLIGSIERLRSLVERERYDYPMGWLAPGLVRGVDSPDGYDVDDLMRVIAPRSVEHVSAEEASAGGWVAALFDGHGAA
jgi:pimeloyl-ACP methyl ester carboxylesterase